MRYDRARKNLDRHPNYILAAYMASGTCTQHRRRTGTSAHPAAEAGGRSGMFTVARCPAHCCDDPRPRCKSGSWPRTGERKIPRR
jgi:hypothetical protein